MKDKEVNVHDFCNWLNQEVVNYAHSARENKRLSADLRGNIIVTVGGKVEYSGGIPESAVEIYNQITAKWENPLKDFKI